GRSGGLDGRLAAFGRRAEIGADPGGADARVPRRCRRAGRRRTGPLHLLERQLGPRPAQAPQVLPSLYAGGDLSGLLGLSVLLPPMAEWQPDCRRYEDAAPG